MAVPVRPRLRVRGPDYIVGSFVYLIYSIGVNVYPDAEKHYLVRYCKNFVYLHCIKTKLLWQ